MKRHHLTDKIKTKWDCLSYDETIEKIQFYAKRIAEDNTSTLCNLAKIESLRSVLNLYEEYNEQLEMLERKEIQDKVNGVTE